MEILTMKKGRLWSDERLLIIIARGKRIVLNIIL